RARPRAAGEAIGVTRERARPTRPVVRTPGLADPELDALGPHAVSAPAFGSRDLALRASRDLGDAREQRGAGGERSTLIARRGGGARVERARRPVPIAFGVGDVGDRARDTNLSLDDVPVEHERGPRPRGELGALVAVTIRVEHERASVGIEA